MKPYSGARLPVFWCACLVAAAGLLAIEMSFLTLPGIQQDEALFLQPFLHGGWSLFSVAIGGSRLPVMLMDYIGCLKTWLYWPIFQIWHPGVDRKSTRLNSSHLGISYAVFCLKKKN